MLFSYSVKADGFNGIAKISVPGYSQRLKYIRDCNFQVNAEGQVTQDISQVDSVVKMLEIAKNHVKEVDIVHVESGEHYKSFEQLDYDSACEPVLIELASKVLEGVKLGKN